jgi:hypothetical protein
MINVPLIMKKTGLNLLPALIRTDYRRSQRGIANIEVYIITGDSVKSDVSLMAASKKRHASSSERTVISFSCNMPIP